jgi:hypothetical protein
LVDGVAGLRYLSARVGDARNGFITEQAQVDELPQVAGCNRVYSGDVAVDMASNSQTCISV